MSASQRSECPPDGRVSNSHLDDALQLLRRLNQMTDIDGREFFTYSVVDGFEPWWFWQEQAYWRLLVPYALHGPLVRNLFAGEPVDDLAGMFRRIWSLGSAGVEVPLTIYRDGALIGINVRSCNRADRLKSSRLH